MKRTAIILMILVTGFTLLGSSTVFARPHGRGAMEHGGPDMGFGMLRMLEKMGLSEEQEKQVAALLKSHREEIRQLLGTMEQSRSDLRETLRATDYSDTALKQTARAVAEQQEQIILLRAKIMHGVRSILTSEQNERLMKVVEQRADRMTEFKESRMSALDTWIEKHGN